MAHHWWKPARGLLSRANNYKTHVAVSGWGLPQTGPAHRFASPGLIKGEKLSLVIIDTASFPPCAGLSEHLGRRRAGLDHSSLNFLQPAGSSVGVELGPGVSARGQTFWSSSISRGLAHCLTRRWWSRGVYPAWPHLASTTPLGFPSPRGFSQWPARSPPFVQQTSSTPAQDCLHLKQLNQ